MNGFEWLDDVAKKIEDDAGKGVASETRLTVREFLGKFGYARRGAVIVNAILNELGKRNLRTVPSFDTAWFDGIISIEMDEEGGGHDVGSDPTIRIEILPAANKAPISVKPNDRTSKAVTIMQLNDFSQLPVMTNERSVKGVVSWKSITARTSLGRPSEFVRQCMDTERVIDISTPLLDAVEVIQRHDYVLVKDSTNRITGIVTASDIAQQFSQLSSPFLLIGEIEGRLRHIVHGKFTLDELRSASPNTEGDKSIQGPADLTFGGYVQLLQEEHWNRLGLVGIDRKEFVKRLDAAREIRNDVMHFNPEGLDDNQRGELEEVAKFFRYLASMGAI